MGEAFKTGSFILILGAIAIPALSAAWAVKKKRAIRVSIESVLRVTMLIAMAQDFPDYFVGGTLTVGKMWGRFLKVFFCH